MPTRPPTRPSQSEPRRPSDQRISLRLPLPLAARLAALCELHPDRPRAKILVDLLNLGLAEVERASPPPAGQTAAVPRAGPPPVYLLGGPFPEFHHLLVKHHRRLERELAAEDPEIPAAPDAYDLNPDDA
jgi:hypothetical protein